MSNNDEQFFLGMPDLRQLFNYSNSSDNQKSTMSYSSASMGINIPQVIVAGVENVALTRGKMSHTALMAASVGVSNLLPQYGTSYSTATEKYLLEPIIAGILYAAGSKYLVSGEKEGGLMKSFVKGMIIGSSSAAIAGSLYGVTAASVRPQSIYSSTSPGLRSAANVPATGAKFIVS